VHAGYGALNVLRDVTMHVDAGEFIAVLGRNGAGKSTLLRAIARIEARVRSGAIVFNGRDLTHVAVERIARLGCSYVPAGRALFTDLSVDDNLRLGGYSRSRRDAKAAVEEVYARFPALGERRNQPAFVLSGGEQQMLAIGRALVAKPALLMLDEPSKGLAPLAVERIFTMLSDLVRAGTALLVVEQSVDLVLRYADRAYVFENGAISLSGPARDLRNDSRIGEIYLGGGTHAL